MRVFLILMGVVLLVSCSNRSGFVEAPVLEGAEYVGTEACLECHEDYAEKTNVHLRLAEFEVKGVSGCEACHGPGSKHAELMGEDETEEGLKWIFRFGEEGLSPEKASAICLKCHSKGSVAAYALSEHMEEGVSCNECHGVHRNEKKYLLKKEDPALCSSCHSDIRAKFYFPSHHPLKEGHMKCSDCHSPHGTLNAVSAMLKTEERLNDLCVKCHTRYQGPFVFEHEPVVEDCTICHDPHGAVANNLLRQNEPFLCMQCHEVHFHATRLSDTQNFYTPVGDVNDEIPDSGFVSPSADAFARAFLTKCTQCHQQIHGTDLPSQSIPGQGKMLIR